MKMIMFKEKQLIYRKKITKLIQIEGTNKEKPKIILVEIVNITCQLRYREYRTLDKI